ncbi:unnamed protein product [Moneuplotes crassus]|uniref:Endonuclease/exonuclease/phosphatase domain-containing protein n=1 Tax=Euplotes crassus TaxID=5936 RepID=A0AAD1XEB6_EUPCR|nr:unnamed protein product [Moneuplotes crassus]
MHFREFTTSAKRLTKRPDVIEKTRIFTEMIQNSEDDYSLKSEIVRKTNKYLQLKNKMGEFTTPQLKIDAWNVNGIRAGIRKKTLQKYFEESDPDIVCFNETKICENKIKEFKLDPVISDKYISFYNCCKSPHAGYSGTAIFSKFYPKKVYYGLGTPENDAEGRILTCGNNPSISPCTLHRVCRLFRGISLHSKLNGRL